MSTKKNYKDMDLSAYFIGPHGENGDLFKELAAKLTDDHIGWRKNYNAGDEDSISEDEKATPEFNNAVVNMKDVLNELSRKLRDGSIPWDTAGRYLSQMDNETLMPAILAYNFAMLWNGNGVAWAGSPASTLMEQEVGHQLAEMHGYDKNGWGYVATDGSIANVSALWMARNVASIPLAIKEVCPELVEGKTEWELLNMSVKEELDLLDQAGDKKNEVKAHSARSGKNLQKLGKWLVPSTMHYSWRKACDITGVGEDNLVVLPVDDHYRIDLDKLDKIIAENVEKHIPILGVVAVVGTTEEGQIDHVDKIVEMRNKWIKKGVNFYIHVDAAYGGYGRTVYLDEDNNFIPYEDLKEVHQKYGVFQEDKEYISKEVYNAYKAFPEAQSITVDPHKMGYVPYAAGGIAIRHKDMRDIIGYFPVYVYDKRSGAPATLTPYILEGSKAGATAAAVWTAHRIMPLNVSGYGKLIGRSIEAANRYYEFLKNLHFNINGTEVEVNPLTQPDFNMVDWVYKEEGNDSLKAMNDLTQAVMEYTTTAKGGKLYNMDIQLSDTSFEPDNYGDAPVKFIESLGMTADEYHKLGKLEVLRSSCMSPWMYDEDSVEYWSKEITAAIQDKLEKVAKNENIL